MKYISLMMSVAFASVVSPSEGRAWTIDANFEAGTPSAKAEGSGAFTEAFSNTKYTDRIVHSGALAVEVSIEAGDTGFGRWGGAFSFPSDLHEGDEIWFRIYAFFPAGFDYSCTKCAALKMMRIHTATSTGQNEGYLDLLINNGNSLVGGSELGTGWYANNPGWKELGGPVTTGEWHAFEQYYKFSSKPGQGITRLWQNGKLIKEETATATLRTASSKSDLVYLFTYWNGGAPVSQRAYVDDVVITTERPSQRDADGNAFVGVTDGSSNPDPDPPSNAPPQAPTLSVE